MRIQILGVVIFLTAIACDRTSSDQVACNPYFTFDKVEYYSIVISEQAVMELYEKEHKTKKDSKLLDLLNGDEPDTLADIAMFRGIERLGFKKKRIPQEKIAQLNEIFCERKHEEGLYTTCIAIYRDILIFKKKNKTVGFARICFDCGDAIIAGTNRDWSEFGQSGDYQKLGAILHSAK